MDQFPTEEMQLPNKYKVTFKHGLQLFRGIISAFSLADAEAQFYSYRYCNNMMTDVVIISYCPYVGVDPTHEELCENNPFAMIITPEN